MSTWHTAATAVSPGIAAASFLLKTMTCDMLRRRMTGEYVYFATVVLIALVMVLVVAVNYQWGASFFTFLLLIAMLLAVVGHDE